MADVNIRYWKRNDKTGTIYFATATNAGHDKAENDPDATEIAFNEYKDNVPDKVHNGADRGAPPHAALQGKQAAWEALQHWTAEYGETVAVQDQIAMLELWKFQLCSWASSTMAAQPTPGSSTHVN
jgi:hypothetical protein